jgi:thioredoxin 1
MITLIDFYAEWCGPCKAMKPVLERFESNMGDSVEVKKIDVDVNQSEASKYGIVSIPTLVILKNGAEVSRKSGVLNDKMLKDWVEGYL